MNREVWIVFQHPDEGGEPQLCGVFSTREKAKSACRTERYCRCLVTLDDAAPHETVGEEWFRKIEWGNA